MSNEARTLDERFERIEKFCKELLASEEPCDPNSALDLATDFLEFAKVYRADAAARVADEGPP